MKITVHGGRDMARALEAWPVPEACDELIIAAPEAKRFTNCLRDSPVNCRVTVVPPSGDAVSYAGLFSGCRFLGHQPTVDVSKCINMAAFMKECKEARYNLYTFRQTANVRDMRQCLMGCVNLSGNGLQFWDFSGLSSEDSMRNFAHGTAFRTNYYDGLIENLFSQARAGTLPTPMHAVNFGSAKFSPRVKEMRRFVIDYGWDIGDGGEVPYELSPLEREFSDSVDRRLEADDFPGDIDLSPVVRTARNGILISPRHVLYVKHYQPAPGQTITFWHGEQAVIQKSTPGGWDIAVATLRDPVSIRPALVFGPNWQQQLPLLEGPPKRYPDGTCPALLFFNQRKEIGVWDWSYANDVPPFSQGLRSTSPRRLQRHLGVALGDSGSPVCAVYGSRLVVSHAVAVSSGSGVFTGSVSEWLAEVTQGTVEVL
jgi:hypothetical protein